MRLRVAASSRSAHRPRKGLLARAAEPALPIRGDAGGKHSPQCPRQLTPAGKALAAAHAMAAIAIGGRSQFPAALDERRLYGLRLPPDLIAPRALAAR